MSVCASYELMSLDEVVAELNMNRGEITDLVEISIPELMPIGARDFISLREWFMSRNIPASRNHLDKLKFTVDELVSKSMGLSLSDTYWVRPSESGLFWKDVNFFTNNFMDDIGEYLIRGEGEVPTNIFSPTNATNGVVSKKWIIVNKDRFLVKVNTDRGFENFNEEFGGKSGRCLAEGSNIKVLKYSLYEENSCLCANFIKEGKNLVTAANYLKHHGINMSDKGKVLDFLRNAFGRDYLDFIIILDYIIMNTDRHLGNLAFIQDANTGVIEEWSHVFDSGFSMRNIVNPDDEYDEHLNMREHFACSSFKQFHHEQIRLADKSNYINQLGKLRDCVCSLVFDVYSKSDMSENGLERFGRFLFNRIDDLL